MGGNILDGENEYPLILLMGANLKPEKEVLFPATYGGDINEVIEMSGGEIFGIGTYWFVSGSRIIFAETNQSGNNVLNKNLSFADLAGMDAVYGDAATATSDGNVMIAGHYQYFSGGFQVAFLKKVDLDGNLIWENDYTNEASIEGNRIPSAVIHTSDGGYLMVGTHKMYTANPDIFLLKVNANGQYQWDRSYGGSFADYATDVLEEIDGGFVIVGATRSFNEGIEESRVYFLKTDSLGFIE